jgi:hypothetical protein
MESLLEPDRATVRFLRMGGGEHFRVIAVHNGAPLGEVRKNAQGSWTAIKRGMPDLIVGGWGSRRSAAEFLAAGAERKRSMT